MIGRFPFRVQPRERDRRRDECREELYLDAVNIYGDERPGRPLHPREHLTLHLEPLLRVPVPAIPGELPGHGLDTVYWLTGLEPSNRIHRCRPIRYRPRCTCLREKLGIPSCRLKWWRG
jgi:hypothetical protein